MLLRRGCLTRFASVRFLQLYGVIGKRIVVFCFCFCFRSWVIVYLFQLFALWPERRKEKVRACKSFERGDERTCAHLNWEGEYETHEA